MTWKLVTERDYDPTPAKPDGLDFCLTPQERDQAKIVSIALERNRRKQNELELQRALERYVPDDAA